MMQPKQICLFATALISSPLHLHGPPCGFAQLIGGSRRHGTYHSGSLGILGGKRMQRASDAMRFSAVSLGHVPTDEKIEEDSNQDWTSRLSVF
jgi:hypothetical protein